MNKDCKHEIIYVEEVFNGKTYKFDKVGKCLFCGKKYTEEELNNLEDALIIPAYIPKDNNQTSYVSYRSLQTYAKRLNSKYASFNGQELPIDRLYHLLIEHFS